MQVVGFSGYSNSGKTTLIERLVGRLRQGGRRVSVIKHTHHDFDLEPPGKDSRRHREAGAYEVLIASEHRLAKIRELDSPTPPDLHRLVAELDPCDWVLVEGFRHARWPKLEIWRAVTGHPLQHPSDHHVVAICTDSPAGLAASADLPILDLNDIEAIAGFLEAHAQRFVYRADAGR